MAQGLRGHASSGVGSVGPFAGLPGRTDHAHDGEVSTPPQSSRRDRTAGGCLTGRNGPFSFAIFHRVGPGSVLAVVEVAVTLAVPRSVLLASFNLIIGWNGLRGRRR